MAYKVLYRKYRPKDFNSLYGQDNIKKLLIDSIINEKLSHAYLFSGPRGTGKTSTAKLFAKTINCENQVNGIPCDKCQSCINSEQSPDIIEIDAASNNGVDEIRDLRDNAKVLPTYSKYKIYIIDEVHMLSQSAWNAFLKILEEPPKHVIFILATTEIQKIPITILSRCQRFNFQRIDQITIRDNILRIAKLENITITEEGADYLANLSDGGMRDALSLLDQLSKENQEINKDLIIKAFGILTENEINEIFRYLQEGNIIKINKMFDEYFKKGLDTNHLISKIINFLYEEEIRIFNNKKSFLSIEQIKQMVNEIITCYNKTDALNMIRIIIYSYIPHENKDKIISREIILEENPKINNSDLNSQYEKNKKSLNSSIITDDIIKIRINNAFVGANKEKKEQFKKDWQSFINKEKIKNNIDIVSKIEDINIEVVGEKNIIFSNKSQSSIVLFNDSLQTIEEEFKKNIKKSFKFICLTDDEWQKIKADFIKNKNKVYEYMNEPKNNKEMNKALDEALNVFSEDQVEIK